MTASYLSQTEGKVSAGKHLIVDFWHGQSFDDVDFVKQALNDAALKAKATILHTHLHKFSDNGGVTGVVVLAESHISIHTWPEINYAALDIFMCGESEPELALEALEASFKPKKIERQLIMRGEL